MVRKFPPFRSERKKRSTSVGTPQFSNGISGKLPYHLTSNRNFRIFSPNGKHPGSIMLTSLFHVTGECHRFLRRGWATLFSELVWHFVVVMCFSYGKPIVAIFNNSIYIQFSIYIYVIFFLFIQFNIYIYLYLSIFI